MRVDVNALIDVNCDSRHVDLYKLHIYAHEIFRLRSIEEKGIAEISSAITCLQCDRNTIALVVN